MKKINVLEGIRGIAVLMVFFDHAYLGVGPRLGQAAVYIFFILSAFLMFTPFFANKEYEFNVKNYLKYLVRRIFRVIPVYWFVVIIYVADRILTDTVGYLTPIKLFYNAIFLQGVGPFDFRLITQSWTLVIEMQFYLFIPLIAFWLMKKEKNIFRNLAILFVISYILRIISIYVFGLKYGNPMFFLYYDLFAIGTMLSYLWSTNQLEKLGKSLKVIAVPLFLVYTAATIFSNLKYGNEIIVGLVIPTIAVLSFFVFAFLLTNENHLITRIIGNKFFQFIGTIGYSFYLIHIFVLKYTGYQKISDVIIAFVITVLISLILKKLIEDPFIKLGKKICLKIDET
ncbi:MAG: acyltransferase family protein [Mycoplasmatales bacterium]